MEFISICAMPHNANFAAVGKKNDKCVLIWTDIAGNTRIEKYKIPFPNSLNESIGVWFPKHFVKTLGMKTLQEIADFLDEPLDLT